MNWVTDWRIRIQVFSGSGSGYFLGQDPVSSDHDSDSFLKPKFEFLSNDSGRLYPCIGLQTCGSGFFFIRFRFFLSTMIQNKSLNQNPNFIKRHRATVSMNWVTDLRIRIKVFFRVRIRFYYNPVPVSFDQDSDSFLKLKFEFLSNDSGQLYP